MIQKGTGSFEILSGDELIASGRVLVSVGGENILMPVNDLPTIRECVRLSGTDIYNEYIHRGHNYNGKYKCIKNITLHEEGSIGSIVWQNDWSIFIEGLLQQVTFQKGEKYQNLTLPTSILRIAVSLPRLPKEEIKGLQNLN